jgi:hypothetical protein
MWCVKCEAAEDKVSYLGLRANTLKKHENGQPWAHGRKLRKEQQRRQQQQKQEVEQRIAGGARGRASGMRG